MSQMNGQEKIPEKQLNEVEMGKLSEKEFRITLVKKEQRRCKECLPKT